MVLVFGEVPIQVLERDHPGNFLELVAKALDQATCTTKRILPFLI